MVWLDEPERAAEKSKPMPASGTAAPVASALLPAVRLPLVAPAPVAANSTPTVQLAPAANVEGQALLTNLKPAVTATAKSVRLEVALGLVRVTVTGLLS